MRGIGARRGTGKGSKPRVIVAGAGFAGLAVARGLPSSLEVTVVDQSTHFEFLPNIHELISGIKGVEELRLPIEPVLRRAGHAFVRGRIVELDLDRRVLSLLSGAELGYDVLVVALGGVNDTYGVPGAERHALPFKSVADCARIGRAAGALVEAGSPSTIVVVGGGLEGVEALGELLRRRGERPSPALHLIEAGPRLLPSTPAPVDEAVRVHCRRHGVELHLGARVERVAEDAVVLSDGETLQSDLTLWTGGAAAPRLLAESGLADADGRWARARATLQSVARDEVFVVGDAAGLDPVVSKQAYHALDMGSLAAGNVRRLLRGARLEGFEPSGKPVVISFGDLDTFVIAGDRALAGPPLAPLKEAVFQLVMAQLDPPVTPRGLFGALGRAARGVGSVGLPSLSTLASFEKLRGVRVLSGRGGADR